MINKWGTNQYLRFLFIQPLCQIIHTSIYGNVFKSVNRFTLNRFFTRGNEIATRVKR
jgi:hypothetical protein